MAYRFSILEFIRALNEVRLGTLSDDTVKLFKGLSRELKLEDSRITPMELYVLPHHFFMINIYSHISTLDTLSANKSMMPTPKNWPIFAVY